MIIMPTKEKKPVDSPVLITLFSLSIMLYYVVEIKDN